MVLQRRCAAPPEVVYDLLADPASHAEWGGDRQLRVFRLTGLEASSTPLTIGSTFTSTGSVFIAYQTRDHSRVTVAEPGRRFEFVTENRYTRRCEGTYVNRYDLAPAGPGCVVTYTFRRVRLVSPPLHMRGPMRWAIQRFGAPRLFGRGLDNLVRMAERLARGRDPLSLTPYATPQWAASETLVRPASGQRSHQ
jgi:hypothetical protein